MDVTSALIKLYSTHTTEAIESSGALLLKHFAVPDINSLIRIDGYTEAFSLVSDCAKTIDRLSAQLAGQPPGLMVRENIRLLRDMLDQRVLVKKQDVMRSLIEGRLYPKWDPLAQALYDRKKAILEWRDFFVSYTNRDAPATNGQFRRLIKSALGIVPKGADNQLNYVARVITRHLRRYQGLTGFFDEEDLKMGETLNHQVDQFCRKSFALVQIIEPLALASEPPTNWCFYEYSQFTENPDVTASLQRRHYFIVTGTTLGAVRPAALAGPFDPWVRKIDEVRYLALGHESNETIKSKIAEIAKEIVKLRAEVLESWINT